VAAVLLLGGGLKTLQTASIVTGLPFTVVLLLIVYALYLGLSREAYVEDAVKNKLRDVHDDHKRDEAISSAHDELLEKTKAELNDSGQ
jgi:choline-glycine betaine transporter